MAAGRPDLWVLCSSTASRSALGLWETQRKPHTHLQSTPPSTLGTAPPRLKPGRGLQVCVHVRPGCCQQESSDRQHTTRTRGQLAGEQVETGSLRRGCQITRRLLQGCQRRASSHLAVRRAALALVAGRCRFQLCAGGRHALQQGSCASGTQGVQRDLAASTGGTLGRSLSSWALW